MQKQRRVTRMARKSRYTCYECLVVLSLVRLESIYKDNDSLSYQSYTRALGHIKKTRCQLVHRQDYCNPSGYFILEKCFNCKASSPLRISDNSKE